MLAGDQIYVLILRDAGVDHLFFNHNLHSAGQSSLTAREEILLQLNRASCSFRLLRLVCTLVTVPLLQVAAMLGLVLMLGGRALILLVEIVINGHLLVLIRYAGHARDQLMPLWLLADLILHCFMRGCHSLLIFEPPTVFRHKLLSCAVRLLRACRCFGKI